MLNTLLYIILVIIAIIIIIVLLKYLFAVIVVAPYAYAISDKEEGEEKADFIAIDSCDDKECIAALAHHCIRNP